MKKKYYIITALFLVGVFCCLLLSSCKKTKKPEVPDSIENNGTEPTISVFDIETNAISEQKLEDYVEGVVAGEMFNDWPLEALKAQSILARTFTLYFIANRDSKYENADISNDISEAQAYDKSSINENVKKAVAETRGKVVSVDGEFIETWFHSNSGGKTGSIKEGISLAGTEPEFIKYASSPENTTNSQNSVWTATFTKTEILNALRKMNKSVSSVSSFEIDKKGNSGRTLTLSIGGEIVSSAEFRLAIGSTKMKSTWITSIKRIESGFEISGKGFGHGVGLSQWGAKLLAEDGKSANDIIHHYYSNVDIIQLWK